VPRGGRHPAGDRDRVQPAVTWWRGLGCRRYETLGVLDRDQVEPAPLCQGEAVDPVAGVEAVVAGTIRLGGRRGMGARLVEDDGKVQ